MNKRILAFLAIFAVVLGAAIGAMILLAPKNEEKVQSLTDQGILATVQELKKSGAFLQAYKRASIWLEQNEPRADLEFEAGLLSILLRDLDVAHTHMSAAWDLGIKKFSVLLVIVETIEVGLEEKIETFDRLFAELPATPEHLNAKARFYSQVGRNREALAIWNELNQASPNEAIVMQIARKLEMIGRRNDALSELRKNREFLGAEGTNLLASLLVFANQFEDAAKVIKTAQLDDPHSEWAFKQAMFSLMLGDLPAAHQQLKRLTQLDSTHPVALVVAHESRIAAAILDALLNGNDADYASLAQSAQEIISSFPQREVTTPLLGLKANPKQIEAEQILYQYLKSLNSRRQTPNDLFIRLEPFLKDSPAISWLAIRNALVSGNAADAVSLYNGIDDMHPLERVEGASGFFYKSPLFITEAARAFLIDGSERECLDLISHLHDRNLYSPSTIRLFAEATQSEGLTPEAFAMQEALGRQFPDDLGIQLTAINQAYQLGQADRALELTTPLRSANEENTELKMLELMLLLEEGQTDQLLKRLEKISLPERNKSLVRARVAIAANDRKAAENHFKQALDPTNFYAYLDYARFLVEEGQTEQATELYKAILERQIDNRVALQGLAIIMELENKPQDAIRFLQSILRIDATDTYAHTRLAKLYLQIQEPRNALQSANKALSRNPSDADAGYLQVTAMIQLALEQTAQTAQVRKLAEAETRLAELSSNGSPNLFLDIYLASAYREVGLEDHSKEIYRRLLAMDDSQWRSANLSRNDVELALKNLSE